MARRVIWLSAVKEALGCIPNYIPIDYEELQFLIILGDEQGKKLGHENYKMRKETEQQMAKQKLDDLAG